MTVCFLFGCAETAADWWHPAPGLHWHIQFEGRLKIPPKTEVVDIDLVKTTKRKIRRLHAQGMKVVCYFSAGSFEVWRPDADRFPRQLLGNDLVGWPGEKWLDISQHQTLLPLLERRMRLAVAKACDGVDPDNVDGYNNDSGFPLTAAQQLRFNKALAHRAHRLGLAIGLKNDLEQIPQLVDHFDFAVNEECFYYRECSALMPFILAGKAVFGIEYDLPTTAFCAQANAARLDFVRKRWNLDAWVKACR